MTELLGLCSRLLHLSNNIYADEVIWAGLGGRQSKGPPAPPLTARLPAFLVVTARESLRFIVDMLEALESEFSYMTRV